MRRITILVILVGVISPYYVVLGISLRDWLHKELQEVRRYGKLISSRNVIYSYLLVSEINQGLVARDHG